MQIQKPSSQSVLRVWFEEHAEYAMTKVLKVLNATRKVERVFLTKVTGFCKTLFDTGSEQSRKYRKNITESVSLSLEQIPRM